MMTLREQWLENRRRRLAGLPEVTREGYEIPKHPPMPGNPSGTPGNWTQEIIETYDPSRRNYRMYQGD